MSELLAKALDQGALDQAVTLEDRERPLEGLQGWNVLDSRHAYRATEATGGVRGRDIPPGGGLMPDKVPSQPAGLSALLDSGLWGQLFGFNSYSFEPPMFEPAGGMDAITDAFAREVEDVIQLNARVTRIAQGADGVTVPHEDRGRGGTMREETADWCICIILLSVFVQIEVDCPDEIRKAIAAVPHAAAFKAALEFRRCFREQDDGILGGVSYTDLPLVQIAYPNYGFLSDGPAVLQAAYDTATGGRNRPSFDPWDDRGERYGRSADYAFNDDDHHWYGSGRMSGGGHREAPSLTDDKDDGPGLAGTIRQTASSMGEAVSDTASDLMDRLSHGLGNLSDDARDRVIAARRAAHEARQSSQAMIDRGTQGAAGFFEEQPLVVGALAMALGAALGGALPHSRIEDRTMGESSDRLFAKAQTLLQEEREKAERMMKTSAADLKDEVRDIGDDIAELVPEGKTAGEAIVDRAAASASRIVENATGGSDDHKRGQTQS
ncbi:MAG: FAD-dependent oxidoreductase [Rubellimicrobium sp.]|nr:FAD-dependent oxidoreductase [Rubellimicrobium sp.]